MQRHHPNNTMQWLLLAVILLGLPLDVTAQRSTITVHVENAPPGAAVTVQVYADPFTWREVHLDSVLPDASGTATLTFSVEHPTPAELHIARQYARLFLEPGMELTINLDYAAFDETITFQGTSAANQRYLLRELLRNFRAAQNRYSMYDDAQGFSNYLDSLQAFHRTFYRESDTANMTAPFREYARRMIEYQYVYPRNMFTYDFDPQTRAFTERDLPDAYYEPMKGLPLDDNIHAETVEYYIAVDTYLTRFVVTDRQNPMATYGEVRDALSGRMRDVHLGAVLRLSMPQLAADPDLGDALVGDYRRTCSTPRYVAVIDSMYAIARSLAPSNLIPDLTAVDSSGSLHTLSELRGKVVYLDLWATWCAPCVAAMDDSHARCGKQFAGTDVAFVYINVEDDIGRWESFTRTEDLGPYNWFADGDRTEIIKEQLGMDGLPRYMIIDRDGIIVSSKAAGPDRVADDIQAALQR